MEIKRNGTRPSEKGSADFFTGSVRVDPLFDAPEPARVFGAYVTFEPGARTAYSTGGASTGTAPSDRRRSRPRGEERKDRSRRTPGDGFSRKTIQIDLPSG